MQTEQGKQQQTILVNPLIRLIRVQTIGKQGREGEENTQNISLDISKSGCSRGKRKGKAPIPTHIQEGNGEETANSMPGAAKLLAPDRFSRTSEELRQAQPGKGIACPVNAEWNF